MEGQLVAMWNGALEATHADRAFIGGLPPEIDWPTDPEMEVELTTGAGLAYRFMPNWYAGVETQYQTEYETVGGGEKYAGQSDTDLHLIEKTKAEIRLKIGIDF